MATKKQGKKSTEKTVDYSSHGPEIYPEATAEMEAAAFEIVEKIGARYDYDFTVRNRGGTYWYHTHAHELTAKQAYNGLASFFLVDDNDEVESFTSVDELIETVRGLGIKFAEIHM